MSCLVEYLGALQLGPTSSQTQELLVSAQADNSIVMPSAVKQPYDAFLVLDVEATCIEGSPRGEYPNEIIEWPVCLLRWRDKNDNGEAKSLEVVDEFRSFVRPTWRPELSDFCKNLTGITQQQVDDTPTFAKVMESFRDFMIRHGLIDVETGKRLTRFCWCCDGPYDIRDFVVKQCFMSKMQMPTWVQGDMMDVRVLVSDWHASTMQRRPRRNKKNISRAFPLPKRMPLTISRQLQVLGLPPFEGRPHSGIDDTRNITRIVIEVGRRGMKLQPNTPINPNRRWPWMGKLGRVLDDYY
ncbi:hypothetical protein CERSUDRAFT_105200 [Gelatoporia subvermispora B]|uniref:Exonuclease domain-containing protein n=1 Tax=Ceriporiopsis subvermispora (strain B) TaxID=914234 RepID=M2QNI9_CERS8|nr:hypothetical protein CERSUDRAFT_105200 [Gelatoporia subvermispora B]